MLLSSLCRHQGGEPEGRGGGRGGRGGKERRRGGEEEQRMEAKKVKGRGMDESELEQDKRERNTKIESERGENRGRESE